MAGRKPKPTALKKLEGNPGKRKYFIFNSICRPPLPVAAMSEEVALILSASIFAASFF